MIRGDKKDSDILQGYCLLLADNIEDVGTRFSTVNIIQNTYLDLLRRIQFSLLGVAVHLEQWPEMVKLKLPISLAYRTALTDALTGLYLATFHHDISAFQRELMILDLDYFRYVKTIVENTALSMPGASQADVDREIQAREAELYQKAEHLLQTPGGRQLQGPAMIRQSSAPQLFMVPGNIPKRLGEKEMFEQIRAHPDTRHLASMYLMQRHLSQQHHYAPANSGFIQLDPAHDCRNWFESMVYLNEIAGALAGLLEVPEPVLEKFRTAQASLLAMLTDRAES